MVVMSCNKKQKTRYCQEYNLRSVDETVAFVRERLENFGLTAILQLIDFGFPMGYDGCGTLNSQRYIP